MKIWVDADACPVAIKEIIFRAAERTKTETILVANHSMRVPQSSFVRLQQVLKGFDVADNEIVNNVFSGDIVITGDIPLASDAIDKGAYVLSPRGEEFDEDNIKQRLNMRDFMDTLRSSGIETPGPSSLSQSDRQKFANALDRLLTRHKSS